MLLMLLRYDYAAISRHTPLLISLRHYFRRLLLPRDDVYESALRYALLRRMPTATADGQYERIYVRHHVVKR